MESEKIRILYIDNNKTCLNLVKKVYEFYFVNVKFDAVGTNDRALRKFRHSNYDVVFYRMGMHDKRVIDELKRRKSDSVIVSMGHTNTEENGCLDHFLECVDVSTASEKMINLLALEKIYLMKRTPGHRQRKYGGEYY